MLNNVNIHGLSHQPDQSDRKRASNNDSILNEVQPLNSNKKAKTLPTNLKSDGLREPARQFTSEPYVQHLRAVCSSDLLLGRGGRALSHEGNVYLRSLITTGSDTCPAVNIETHKQLEKPKKTAIHLQLLKELHHDTPRRRFLQKDKISNCYYEVDDKVALEKIAQTIRNLRRPQFKNIQNQEKSNAQYTLAENHESFEPIPFSLATNKNDHLSGLLNDSAFEPFLDYLRESYYEGIFQPSLVKDDPSFEPIPLSSTTNEERQLQELLRDPSLSVFLDHLKE
jgi:hypothetical protein